MLAARDVALERDDAGCVRDEAAYVGTSTMAKSFMRAAFQNNYA